MFHVKANLLYKTLICVFLHFPVSSFVSFVPLCELSEMSSFFHFSFLISHLFGTPSAHVY
jgi:hypothetical protein